MASKARAATLKHSYVHLPSTRDAREWLKKPLVREIEIDTALIVLCFLLYGAVLFSLFKAFGDYQIIP
jgi:hypothetical protein